MRCAAVLAIKSCGDGANNVAGDGLSGPGCWHCWSAVLGSNYWRSTGPQPWAGAFLRSPRSWHWSACLGRSTGLQFWAEALVLISGRETGPQFWAGTLVRSSGPRHWSEFLGRDTGQHFWAGTLVRSCGHGHWSAALGRSTGPLS